MESYRNNSFGRFCLPALAVVLAFVNALAQGVSPPVPRVPPSGLSDNKVVPVTAATRLFNGRTLDGWAYIASGKPADIAEVCQVKDGVLVVAGVPGKSTGYIELPEVRADYQLHVEWRWATSTVTASTNSGVLLNLSPGALQQELWPVSLQLQLKAGRAGDIISMSTAACAEAASGQTASRQKDASEKPAGEWNTADIVVRGDTIECTINGVMQSKVTKCVPSSGKIGFQLEGYAYELRNLSLSPLVAQTPAAKKAG